MQRQNLVSVIIPVYNEQDNIEPLVKALLPEVEKLDKIEVVIVDDGSTDNTFEKLETESKKYPFLKIVRLHRNQGKTAAYNAGFENSSGNIVITMDGDLQDNPADIPKLLKKLDEGYDLVKGWKCTGKGKITRTIPSKIFNLIISILMNSKFHDMNCPMRAMTRECVNSLHLDGGLYRFIPLIAKAKGFNVAEVKIDNSPRYSGHSKYGNKRFLKGFFDLITVYFLVRFQQSPLHLFGSIGLPMFMLGFSIDLFLVLRGFLVTGVIGHFAMLLFGVLLMLMGIQLIATGLIGELIIRMNRQNSESVPVENVLNFTSSQHPEQL